MAAPNPNQDASIRKRQQIDSSKRTMFISVAAAAFVIGIALVVSFFLAKQIWFHAKIIAAKQDTLSTIKKNIQTVDELKKNVRALDTNEALSSVKTNSEASALQTILDALPAEANADALGASLQNKLAGEVDGVRIDTITIDPVDSTDTEDGQASSTESSEGEAAHHPSIGFRMVVTGSAEGLKNLLGRFEKSIRVIKLDSVEVQAAEGDLMMTIAGKAFYEPARTIELGTRVEKP